MLKKWYISTFIVILTFLGVVSQQQTITPNQEIVLQFNDVEVSNDDIEHTIAIVKKQLQDLGVNTIHVYEAGYGHLKITYYSDADIDSIKKIFSKENKLEIDYTAQNHRNQSNKNPLEDNNIGYNLNIYEIQEGNDVDWDFNGINVLELKAKNDRFFEPNLYITFNRLDVSRDDKVEKEAFKARKNIEISTDNTLHKIPEVRAGPLC
ncbi:hypothetical protein MBM09_04745 [Flaviramulus sp. BrNp1-15]|uniref:hypothetical protein n=1 Tax=Flaviramulus sp. BrNp1-15 TaxID=2916754 RepID=UPI001EE8E8FC|nr:hypothetical protein [Flaviramulus sp. BrNp1-15]ULC60300.1 hypothetical protein MBM09_04745 [Flaviramulus sp. BrNp1-15]